MQHDIVLQGNITQHPWQQTLIQLLLVRLMTKLITIQSNWQILDSVTQIQISPRTTVLVLYFH